jgi:hypothetical protein
MTTRYDLVRSARLQLYMMRARDCENAVLQYHRETNNLCPWKW